MVQAYLINIENLRLIAFIAVFAFFPLQASGGEYYGIMQITNPSTGITQIVIQPADTRKFCAALNSMYWRGMRTSCPHCKLEMSSCDTKLPNAYRDIFEDKPTVFPYVSAPHYRIVLFGAPIFTLKPMCRQIAARMRASTMKPARCVSP